MHTLLHIYSPQYTVYRVLSHTSLGQYVFVPVATLYSSLTDHLSNTTVIRRWLFVCLCLWHCCTLILLPPATLQPASGPFSLSSISTFSNPSSMVHNLKWYKLPSYPSLHLCACSSALIPSFLSFFFHSPSFISPFPLCNPTISLPLCPRLFSYFPSFCLPAIRLTSLPHSILY